MKRFGNLYPQIYTFDNLLSAYKKARKGKRNNPTVAKFEVNMEYELLQLQKELQTETYQPGSYTTFMIYDPKKRMISAAPFRDRVVHHALCNIIEPLFEPTFIFDTYANRKGKGTHTAIIRCQQYLRKYDYVLKADIRKYFPSIDHQLLKQAIRRKLKCPATLRLIETIIDNSNPQEIVPDYFPQDDLFSNIKRRKGLPMGNLTSQFFANLYLSKFDHFVKEKLQVKGYIRYVDDFVLFHNDKKELAAIKDAITLFLQKEARLYVHPNKTQISPSSKGITFLGQRIFKTHRRLNRNNVVRFYRRLEKRLRDYKAGILTPEKLGCQLNSWKGHALYADTWNLRQKIFTALSNESVGIFEKEDVWKILY